MKKSRKWVIIILVIAMITSVIAGVVSLVASSDKNADVLKPLNTFITTLYYKKGKYSDYKLVFLHPDNVMDEASFDKVRNETTVQDYFKFDADSPENLMKHMAVVRGDNKVTIYYLKDINSTEEMKTAKAWTLVNQGGKWLIEN